MGHSKANKKLRKIKKKLWRKYKKKPSFKNKEKFKKAAKTYKRGIISAQEETEIKLINTNDLGQIYSNVKKTLYINLV
jgi:hypothetical protein